MIDHEMQLARIFHEFTAHVRSICSNPLMRPRWSCNPSDDFTTRSMNYDQVLNAALDARGKNLQWETIKANYQYSIKFPEVENQFMAIIWEDPYDKFVFWTSVGSSDNKITFVSGSFLYLKEEEHDTKVFPFNWKNLRGRVLGKDLGVSERLKTFEELLESEQHSQSMEYFKSLATMMKGNEMQKLFFDWQAKKAHVVKISPPPAGIKIGKPELKGCYKNSYRVVDLNPSKDIKYVEGVVMLMGCIPIDHAWNRMGDVYFDVTAGLTKGGKDLTDYCAVIELDASEMYEFASNTGVYGEWKGEAYKKEKGLKESAVNERLDAQQTVDYNDAENLPQFKEILSKGFVDVRTKKNKTIGSFVFSFPMKNVINLFDEYRLYGGKSEDFFRVNLTINADGTLRSYYNDGNAAIINKNSVGKSYAEKFDNLLQYIEKNWKKRVVKDGAVDCIMTTDESQINAFRAKYPAANSPFWKKFESYDISNEGRKFLNKTIASRPDITFDEIFMKAVEENQISLPAVMNMSEVPPVFGKKYPNLEDKRFEEFYHLMTAAQGKRSGYSSSMAEELNAKILIMINKDPKIDYPGLFAKCLEDDFFTPDDISGHESCVPKEAFSIPAIHNIRGKLLGKDLNLI